MLTKKSIKFKRSIKRKSKIHKSMRKKYGVPKCSKGQIIREGSIRKHGSKKYTSKPTCIKAVGNAAKTGHKGVQLFEIQKNVLGNLGYKDIKNKTADSRRKALKKAIKKYKPLSVFREVNAIYVLNKNTNPELAKKLKCDRDWIKTQKEYINR